MIQCFNNRILWAGGYSLAGRKKNAEKKIIAIYHWLSLLLGISLGYPIFIKDHSGWLWKHKIILQIIAEFFSERRRFYIIWLSDLGSVSSSLKSEE